MMHSIRISCVCSSILLITMLPLRTLLAQNPIPNAGFEEWTGNNPDGWSAVNLPGSEVVLRSDDSQAGEFAARIGPSAFANQVLTPLLSVGTDPTVGAPISQRFENLSFFLKYFPRESDSLSVEVFMNVGFTTIGSGKTSFKDSVDSYTQVLIPISYTNGQVPDQAFINIIIRGVGNENPTVGTFALLDSWEFDPNTTSVDNGGDQLPSDFALEQNFPNPFNPETTINYRIAESGPVELAVFNLLGQQVRNLVNEVQLNGAYSVRWNGTNDRGQAVPSGVYIYRLKIGEVTRSKKMILLQ